MLCFSRLTSNKSQILFSENYIKQCQYAYILCIMIIRFYYANVKMCNVCWETSSQNFLLKINHLFCGNYLFCD